MMRLLRTAARMLAARNAAAASIFAFSSFAMMGAVAVVVDVGAGLAARASLQASTDAAALAGAAEIRSGGAVGAALRYSAASGVNGHGDMQVSVPAGFPQLVCSAAVDVSCSNALKANALVFEQQAVVPTYFGRAVGIDSWTIKTRATAVMTAAPTVPLDIVLLLDTTASMNTANGSCSVKGATRLTCALAGGRALLSGLAPTANRVALMTFPGAQSSAEARKHFDCSTSAPRIQNYRNSPVYKVLPLGSDFREKDDSSDLNPASDLSRAFQAGPTGCKQGMSSPGGVGTYYAAAFNEAVNELRSTGRADSQKVIVLLSDGDAGASSSNMPSGKATNQCQQAIDAAAAAREQGIWVYSIAYGASTTKGRSGSCPTDTTPKSACETMQAIASDPSKFYVGNDDSKSTCASSANKVSELVSVFRAIGASMGSDASRLVPNDSI